MWNFFREIVTPNAIKNILEFDFHIALFCKKKREHQAAHLMSNITQRKQHLLYWKKILHRQFMQSFFSWFFRYNWKTSDEKRFTSDSEKASQAVSVCPWVYSGRNLVIQKNLVHFSTSLYCHPNNFEKLIVFSFG